jgi:hypothetical protein
MKKRHLSVVGKEGKPVNSLAALVRRYVALGVPTTDEQESELLALDGAILDAIAAATPLDREWLGAETVPIPRKGELLYCNRKARLAVTVTAAGRIVLPEVQPS